VTKAKGVSGSSTRGLGMVDLLWARVGHAFIGDSGTL